MNNYKNYQQNYAIKKYLKMIHFHFFNDNDNNWLYKRLKFD